MEGKDQNKQESPSPAASVIQPTSDRKNKVPTLIGIVLLLFILGGGGYYLGTQHAKPIETNQQTNLAPTAMVATQPTSPPTPTYSPNESTWKLYTNQAYGFTLQYPADYRIECADRPDGCEDGKGVEQSGAINFYPPKEQDNGYGSISVVYEINLNVKRQPNESLQDYIERSSGWTISRSMAIENLQVDGREAIQAIDGDYGKERNIRTFILLDDNHVLHIYFADKKSIPFDQIKNITTYPNVNIYHQMLSSLRFIPIFDMSVKP